MPDRRRIPQQDVMAEDDDHCGETTQGVKCRVVARSNGDGSRRG
ncbi:hypothetical protein GRAN_0389 [Granulicella sibirica]|uniref:Uncharacterized protein n=1 Tax=Granulicella sibirica TaxID=2479048 RepID=A0A4Q0T4Z8_9BACT|nr:hypothetical protein GRAN_0389 [Granulicella sibirica]